MASTGSERGKYAMVDLATSHSPPPAHKSRRQDKKSWRAPITMISALIAGLGVALAHHFMNVHLNNKLVKDVALSQSWVSRFGTALAFLVKTCFVISVGVAFVQRQWFNFHRHPYRVKDVDALTSVLGNIFSLFSSSTWFRNPILTLLAIVAWTIPFAAVVAPGSLTVITRPIQSQSTLRVSQPNFVNYTAYAIVQAGGGGGFTVASTSDLYRLAYNAASSGQPTPISSENQNETYHLNFEGPAVRCSMANASVIQNLTLGFGTNNIVSYDSSNGSALTKRYVDYPDYVPFVSWVPGDEAAVATAANASGSFSTYMDTLDIVSPDSARIFVMTNAQDPEKTSSWANEGAHSILWDNGEFVSNYTLVNVTECALWNASYNVDFNITYPNQVLTASISNYLNPVAAPGITWTYVQNDTAGVIVSYSAIMRAFGKILVGGALKSHYEQVTTYGTDYDLLNIDWDQAETVQAGLEQLFQNITLSTLGNGNMIKNQTQADLVPVVVGTSPVLYTYDSTDLLLAYGISFLCALISCVIGVHAFFVNNASYQNIFSSFIRATNDPELRALVDVDDAGADPLPKTLADIRLMMR